MVTQFLDKVSTNFLQGYKFPNFCRARLVFKPEPSPLCLVFFQLLSSKCFPKLIQSQDGKTHLRQKVRLLSVPTSEPLGLSKHIVGRSAFQEVNPVGLNKFFFTRHKLCFLH